MLESVPGRLDETTKVPASERFGKLVEQILLTVSRYGTWEKVKQYQHGYGVLPLTQRLINQGYLGCSPDGRSLWITDKARQELSF